MRDHSRNPSGEGAAPASTAASGGTAAPGKLPRVQRRAGRRSGRRGAAVQRVEGDDSNRQHTTEIDIDDGAGSVKHTRSRETEYSDNVSRKRSVSAGADVDLAHGAHVGVGREVESHVGDRNKIRGTDAKIGMVDGHFDAEVARTHRIEDAHGADETHRSLSIDDGQLTVGAGRKHEKNIKVIATGPDGKPHEVDRTVSTATQVHAGLGPDGASIGASKARTDEHGTTRTTSGGVKVDHDSITASAGRTIKTKDGHTFTVSASGGVTVYASEPKKQGDRWIVSFKRTAKGSVGGGGGGEHTGVSVGFGGSRFEDGTRAFKSHKEANEFKEHAAEMIGPEVDPTSFKGAMALRVGESRGTGGAVEGSIGGSASVEGAKLGVSHHESRTHEVDVHRISKNIFEVTYMKSTEKGNDLEAGGALATANDGSTDEQHRSLTVQFNLKTPEGKRAFERFCKDHKVPAEGGKVVSRAHGKSHEAHQGLSITGAGDATWAGKTSEDHVHDRAGTHDSYSGDRAEDYKPGRIMRWLGSKNEHASVSIVGREDNGRFDDYRMEASFSGKDGDFVRSRMASLTNAGRSKGAAGNGSGKWKLTADIPKAKIAQLVHFYRTYPKKLHGPDGELQMAIRAARSQDDVMRALAKHVAEDADPSGVASSAVDPSAGARAIGSAMLDWRVELKGDPNFPGERGHKEIEDKMRRYGEQLAKEGRGAAQLVTEIEGEVKALEQRRDNVANRKKYTDLPDGLRASEIRHINKAISGFENLRHQALVLASQSDPRESDNKRLTRVYTPHMRGYRGMDAAQAQLAKLRDEIAIHDSSIIGQQRMNVEDLVALTHASHHGIDWRRFGEAAGTDQTELEDELALQAERFDKLDATYRSLDDTRAAFLAALSDPPRAVPLGSMLLITLTTIDQQMQDIDTKLMKQGNRHARFMTQRERRSHAKFWNRIGITAADTDIGDGTSMGPVSMRLPDDDNNGR